jgi:exopolysaccharide biosynthesis polyprenyl glycosylphosphotransferase
MTPATVSPRSGRAATSREARAAHVLDAAVFTRVLRRERERADRLAQTLVLAVATLRDDRTGSAALWASVVEGLSVVSGDTGVIGWLEADRSIALTLTDIENAESAQTDEVARRIRQQLSRLLPNDADGISVRLHVHQRRNPTGIEAFLRSRRARYHIVKRMLDIVLSAALLALFSPVFLVVAVLLKLTSPGPVFFRQERIGQMMNPFIMLKFRTMQANADQAIHHEFVSSLIKAGGQAAGDTRLFKIANDPRVTAVGRILRRTSLDELPQLWNVLRGEMSLVGPRPPLAYEVDQYESWHRRRVMEAKPGMTGLWQVRGRSRTTFDEMVRLDLRYARSTSIWTDIRILLATPRAVITGKGAY